MKVILIALAWPRQYWFGILLKLSIAALLKLPLNHAPKFDRSAPDSLVAAWLTVEEQTSLARV